MVRGSVRTWSRAAHPITHGRLFTDGLVVMAYVDVPNLDLALPHNAAGLDDDAYDIAAQASAAWQAASAGAPAGPTSSALKRLAGGSHV